MPPRRSEPRFEGYAAALIAFAIFTVVAGVWSYRAQQRAIDAAWQAELNQLVTVKVGELTDWRNERNGDAAVAAASVPLMPAIGKLLVGHDTPDDRVQAMVWADAIRSHYRYATVAVADASGVLRLISGAPPVRQSEWSATAKAAARGTRVAWRDASGPGLDRQRFFLLAASIGKGSSIGTLLLAVDPSVLQANVLRWPRPGVGYFSLVRRADAGHVRLNAPDLTGAGSSDGAMIDTALRSGLSAEGPVFGVSQRVPDSDWALLAAIGRDEALAPLAVARTRVLAIASAMMLVASLGVALAWRHQTALIAQQQVESDRQRQALRQHYEFMLQFGNDAIFLLDGDGSILEVNDRAIEWFGYSRAELLSMHVSQLRHESAGFGVTWAQLKERRQVVFETLTRRKDGSLLPVEISIRLIKTDDADGFGGHELAQSIVRDTSERHRADERLRHVNRLYAVLSGCSQSMMQSRTQDELFASVCRIATEVGGFKLALVSLLEERTGELVIVARGGESASEAAGVRLSRDGQLGEGASGRSFREERTVVCHDIMTDPTMAPWREFSARCGVGSSIAMPLRLNGRVVGVLGLYAAEVSFFDEAEKRLAEEVADTVSFAIDSIDQERRRQEADAELRINRDRLERVLDAIDEGYFDWSPQTGGSHLGARFHTMLGYAPGERPFGVDVWLEATHPDDRPAAEAALDRFRNARNDFLSIEQRLRTVSGAYIWVATRARVVERNEHGEPTRVVGTQTDITERRKLEDQFVQAQKLESVGRLAGGVAHDFNNLLTVVNGYSHLLLERINEDDPLRPHIEAIEDAGVRAAALTHQLLAFSRKQATQPRVMGLNAAITDFSKLLNRIVGDDVRIELRLDAAPDRILADPSQVHQIVMNLVVNARDAMPAGGRITLCTFNGTAGEHDGAAPFPTVVLTISDTGVGMSADTLAQIYEPFFTTKAHGKGTGLGLSMVYGAVRQSAGSIDVDSALGKGTTFTIAWPQESMEMPDVLDTGGAATRGNGTILLVEDQAQVRQLGIDVLKSLGYKVLAASDGREALRVAEQYAGPIDLMMTDVIMPGMNGRALADAFASDRPKMKVLFTSGHTEDVLGQHGIMREDVAYLQKPYTARSVSAKLQEILKGDAPPMRAASQRRVILVVDDEESVRNLFAEVLGSRYRVLLAADGIEAVEMIRRDRSIDLMVVDLFMPRQEGLETIQTVRGIRPELRIIAMSGAFGGQFLKAAARAGVDATLMKPVQIDQLHAIVDQTLN